jgi:hypothetical protein
MELKTSSASSSFLEMRVLKFKDGIANGAGIMNGRRKKYRQKASNVES